MLKINSEDNLSKLYMKNKKIKVVWLCVVSNDSIRRKLPLRSLLFHNCIRKLLGKQQFYFNDIAQWITNGVINMQAHSEAIELHIVSPHSKIIPNICEFSIDNIHYHFFKHENDSILYRIKKYFCYKSHSFKKNRFLIDKIIKKINPDIVHLYGAENPSYSMYALNTGSKAYPLVVSLQTLMSAPNFENNYPITENEYLFRSTIEKKIIQRADYIGSRVPTFKDYIWNNIKKDAVFLNISLMVGEEIEQYDVVKEYDFIYFSANINKAFDLAIAGFDELQKKHPEVSLLVIGGYSYDYLNSIKKKYPDSNLWKKIHFKGLQPTHLNVTSYVKKARYALLPLKVDFVSGTIREALSLGLPVITTKTEGTPTLNQKRNTVLISDIGDAHQLANNMETLLQSESLKSELVRNGYITLKEMCNNHKEAEILTQAYIEIFNEKNTGKKISDELMSQFDSLLSY